MNLLWSTSACSLTTLPSPEHVPLTKPQSSKPGLGAFPPHLRTCLAYPIVNSLRGVGLLLNSFASLALCLICLILETASKSKLRDILQSSWQVSFKNDKIMIDKEKLKNYSRLKQTATSMCDSRLPSWTRKEKKKEKGTAFFFVCLFVFYKEYSQNSQ